MYKSFVPEQSPACGNLAAEAEHWTRMWSAETLTDNVRGLRRTVEWREIRRRLQPGASILEAGCGLGRWVLLFHEAGYRSTGLDISAPTIARLRTAFPHCDWRNGDVRELPFDDGTFDAIASWGVLEHFEEGPGDVLKEFRRVLRPGGWLFVTVPYLNMRRKRQVGNSTDSREQLPVDTPSAFYQYLFDLPEIDNILRTARFEPETLCPTGLKQGIIVWLGLPTNRKLSLPRRIVAESLARVLPARTFGLMAFAAARKGP